MSAAIRNKLGLEQYRTLLQKNMPKLQMLPTVAMEALELVKQPECRVEEFSSIVERDVTLASNMLKIANSPLYAATREMSSLHGAVVRLGFRECKNLIMSSCVATLTKKLTFQDEWIRDLLWRHSLYTAAIAHNLNSQLQLGFQGEEFTAALLHDLGRFLLASLFPVEFLEIDSLEFFERDDPTPGESEKLGISHTVMAELYGEINSLPPDLIAAMKWHHQPEQSGEHQKLVSLIAMADDMANYYQRTGEGTEYQVTGAPGWDYFCNSPAVQKIESLPAFTEEVIATATNDMQNSNAI